MGYLGLLRRGEILALWVAQTLSILGDRLYAMAVMWIAWEEFGAGAMGLVAIAESVPYILIGSCGRRLVDRFVTAARLAQLDLARVAVVVMLPWSWSAFGLPGLLIFAALLGTCGAVFDPNLGALVPELVERERVQAVNGLMDLTGRIARVAGPGSAGVLLAVMPMAGLFWLDGFTFAVSAVALHFLARRTLGAPGRGASPAAAEATTDGVARSATSGERGRSATEGTDRDPGIRVVLREHPESATLLAVHACGIFASAVSMALPALLASRLGAGAGTYGTVLAVTGVGALLGNAVAGNMRLPKRLPVMYCQAWAVSGVLLAVTGAAGSLPVLLLISAASGAAAPFIAVAFATHVAGFRPVVRRRLLSADQTLIRTAGTLSMLALPALAAADPAKGFLAGGLATVAVSALGYSAVVWQGRARTAKAQTAAESLALEAGQVGQILSGAGRR